MCHVSGLIDSGVFRDLKTLTLDVSNGHVALASGPTSHWKKNTAQWVEFYALLAHARRTADGWVTAERLAKLRSWRRKQFPSVGKEVADHIGWCQRRGPDVLETTEKTKRWRLRASPLRIVALPSEHHIATWLADNTDPIGIEPSSVQWLHHVVHSQIALQAGETTRAEEHAREALAQGFGSTRARRIAAILLVRAVASRTGDAYAVLEEMQMALAGNEDATGDVVWGSDALGRHIQSRIAALLGIYSDAVSADEHVTALVTSCPYLIGKAISLRRLSYIIP